MIIIYICCMRYRSMCIISNVSIIIGCCVTVCDSVYLLLFTRAVTQPGNGLDLSARALYQSEIFFIMADV